jgi:hypothetical protein
MYILIKQTRKRVLLVILIVLFPVLAGTDFYAPQAQASPELTTYHVSVSNGQDTASCGTQSQPCASIQYAVNKAASGQTILVAAGIYTFNATADNCSTALGTTGVICLRNKELTILGGFSPTNWSTPNYVTNLSIIDGQNSTRGILVQAGTGQPTAKLTMQGFTVRNGRVQGASSGADSATFAFGAGMRADFSTVILRDMIFKNNKAMGGNTNSDYGGSAAGGGVALRAGVNTSVLERVVFEGNQVIGGTGVNRGGFGIGGGLFTFQTAVNGNYISLINNLAQGGNSNGSGVCAGGQNADSHGGGAAFHRDSIVRLQYVTALDNRAIGGNAPNGQGGGSFGGGLYAEASHSIEVIDTFLFNNTSLGGNGTNNASGGSVSFGGGLATTNTTAVLNRVSVINNISRGGNGAVIRGSGNGGGTSFVRTTGDSITHVVNSIFADNLAAMGTGSTVSGGGGGGVYMRGIAAEIDHVTIAQNQLNHAGMQGSGVLVISSNIPGSATIANSIIANHSTHFAVHAQPGNTINLYAGLFDTNASNSGGGGTITGLGTMISGPAQFVSPGSPNYDYHIKNNSTAKNVAATSSTEQDIDGDVRDNLPDIGADEYVPPMITQAYGIPITSGSVRLKWDVINMDGILHHYEVAIICSSGASAPREVRCGSSLNIGEQQYLQLSGLTNYATYDAEIRAYNSQNNLLATKTISFMPTDIFVYLPMTRK